MSDHQSLRSGIFMMVAGTSIVPVMDAIAKFLGQNMSPLQITGGRFLFQFIILGIGILLLYGPALLFPKRPVIHAIRGVLLAVATLFFFTALKFLPLADSIAIFFVEPMILTLISAVVLGETIGWHRRIAVILGFLGALLIIRPGTDSFSLASTLPLCAAFFFACYMALTKFVANIDHPATMQFFSGLAASIVIALVLLFFHFYFPNSTFSPHLPSKVEWFWLVGIGVVATAGHLLVVMAVNRAPASVLAPFGYVEIIAATFLGWLVFDDLPNSLTWLGIVIIVLSGAYVFYREQKLELEHTEAPNRL